MATTDLDTLNVSPRSETGKGPNRRLRAKGLVPAVVYGTDGQPVMVSVNYRELEKLLSKPNADTNLFNLGGEAGGKGDTVVFREIQRDPLTRRYLHLDLLRVRMDQEAEFEVPIRATGTPVGVREGGVMETHLRSIVVRCLPANLPEEIVVDIAKLAIAQALHVREVELQDTLTLVTDPEEMLFAVHPPRTAAAETEEGAEPAEGAAKE